MAFELEQAREADAAAIAALRHATARKLTQQYGSGAWSSVNSTLEGVAMEIRSGEVYFAQESAIGLATLRVSKSNPWMGDTGFFTPRPAPLYLTSMAVHPSAQRQGIGRQCLEAVKRLAVAHRAGAIRLDAFDAPAGAGEFYRKCGFREVHRARYFDTPLIWLEYLV